MRDLLSWMWGRYNKNVVTKLLAEEQSVLTYVATEGSKTQGIWAQAPAALTSLPLSVCPFISLFEINFINIIKGLNP